MFIKMIFSGFLNVAGKLIDIDPEHLLQDQSLLLTSITGFSSTVTQPCMAHLTPDFKPTVLSSIALEPGGL